MTDNQSSISFNKEDGNPITFNFQLENGLSVKPILNPPFDVFKNKKDSTLSIHIYLTTENISLIQSFSINDIYVEKEKNIWIILENGYIVLHKLPDTIISSIKNKNIIIVFFDTNKNIISQFKIS
jgi:hypothetical protein